MMQSPSSPLKRARGQTSASCKAEDDDRIPDNSKRSKADAPGGALDPAVASTVAASALSTNKASSPSTTTNGGARTSTAKPAPASAGSAVPTQKVPASIPSNQQEIGLPPPPSLSARSADPSAVPAVRRTVAVVEATTVGATTAAVSGSKKTLVGVGAGEASVIPSNGSSAAGASQPRGGNRLVRCLRWTGIVIVWGLPQVLLYGAWHDAAHALDGSYRRITELEATSAYLANRAESLELLLEERSAASHRDIRNMQSRLDAEMERTHQAQTECRRQP